MLRNEIKRVGYDFVARGPDAFEVAFVDHVKMADEQMDFEKHGRARVSDTKTFDQFQEVLVVDIIEALGRG